MEETSQKSQPPLNIALLPPPGLLGHLIPFIELAKQIVSHRSCTVTLIIPHDGSSMNAQKSLLQHLPATINPIFLPPVSADDLREDDHPEIIVSTRLIRSLPAVRDTLSSLRELGTPAAALVVDHFASYAIGIAKEFGIPAYIFFVVAAYLLSVIMDSAASETQRVPKSITMPGSIVASEDEFPAWMRDSNVGVHKWMFNLSKNYNSPQGILVNSFLELEPAAFEEIAERHSSGPLVYPVGPLIRTSPEAETESECLKWLDDQPPESVLFVCFGSGGTLSAGQFRELALGLEMSGQRFVWVVRTPQENVEAAYVSTRKSITMWPAEFLPQGFVERTRGRGLVMDSWAPQIQVLSHASTGGFLTHCGWNSILEGAVFGVPLIAWPLCFEQKMTAAFLDEGLKAALRVREGENGIVERDQISKVVKELMEGEEGRQIRKRMAQVKIAARNAMSEEGSSLAHVIQNWFNGK